MGQQIHHVEVGGGQDLRLLEISCAYEDRAVGLTGDDKGGALDARVMK